MNLLKFLQSNDFALYLAIASVIFLAPNTYFVFHSFSQLAPIFKEIQAGGVCSILSGAILFYTLRKNYDMAKYFCWFEVFISCYYYITLVGWDWNILPAFGFATVLPLSVFYYSKEIESELKRKYILKNKSNENNLGTTDQQQGSLFADNN
jgi:hypothetical protein